MKRKTTSVVNHIVVTHYFIDGPVQAERVQDFRPQARDHGSATGVQIFDETDDGLRPDLDFFCFETDSGCRSQDKNAL